MAGACWGWGRVLNGFCVGMALCPTEVRGPTVGQLHLGSWSVVMFTAGVWFASQ